MKYHLLPADQRHLIKTDRTRPRTPISIPKVHEHAPATEHGVDFALIKCNLCEPEPAKSQVMIVVGGQAPKAIRSVECYDFQEDRWYQVADLPSRRCRAGLWVLLRARLPFNSGQFWIHFHEPSCSFLRTSFVLFGVAGVVSMAGRVFAVGGFNSSLRERTVDVYDGVRDQWSAVTSMQERRSTLGAAVLGELLYAVGGFNGSIGKGTHPHTKWPKVINMEMWNTEK